MTRTKRFGLAVIFEPLIFWLVVMAIAEPAYGNGISISNNGDSCRYSLEFTIYGGAEPIRATSCTRELSDSEYVRYSYRTWLEREPDPDGYAGWVAFLQNGGSRADVARAFLSSDEYKLICGC